MATIRLFIADDHEVIRRGLEALLRGTDVEIVGEAADGARLIPNLVETQAEVLLLDVRMPPDGLQLLEQVRSTLPDVRVVMISNWDNPTYVARSAAMGAADFLLKGVTAEELAATIRHAAGRNGQRHESMLESIRDVMKRRQDAGAAESMLTNREVQVLRHIALGLSNKEISASLDISVETVKEHVQNILRKIEAVDRTQAAVWAVRKGLA